MSAARPDRGNEQAWRFYDDADSMNLAYSMRYSDAGTTQRDDDD